MVGGAGDGAGMPEMMLSPELVELRDALAKIRAGRRCEINAIRMLELSELFRDAQQTYWAATGRWCILRLRRLDWRYPRGLA